MTSKMNLNVIMGTFHPQRSNISFSHTSAFQIMQKSHDLGGRANAGALSMMWPQISPENRRRAGNTYGPLLLVLLKKMLYRPVAYEMERSCSGRCQGGETSSCSAAREQPSHAASALAHRGRDGSQPWQDTRNDTTWSKSSLKTEESPVQISGGQPILLDAQRSLLLKFLK